MKNLKLFIATVVASVMFANMSNAQEVSKTRDSRKQEFKELRQKNLEKLQLSAEQKIKFNEVSRKYAEQMKGVKEPQEVRLARMKQVKAIQEQKDADMKKILSEAQFKTYLEMKEDLKNKMRERRRK